MLDDLFIEIEKNCGYQLPEDIKEFYRRYKTVNLFAFRGGWQYRFVLVNEIHCVGFDILGKFYEKDRTSSWFTICDVMDGNYVAVDLASEKDNQWNYIDCFHETFGIPGECRVIAKSFAEFLKQSLYSGDSLYYLEKSFKGYGDALE
jgi:cell wall assembly regulator SMI1